MNKVLETTYTTGDMLTVDVGNGKLMQCGFNTQTQEIFSIWFNGKQVPFKRIYPLGAHDVRGQICKVRLKGFKDDIYIFYDDSLGEHVAYKGKPDGTRHLIILLVWSSPKNKE